jgi:FHA domain-containing protein
VIRTCDSCGELYDAEACPRCGARTPRKVVAGGKRPRKNPIDPDLPPLGVDFELLADEEQDLEGPAAETPPGARICPSCGKVYGLDYADTFCVCGVELSPASAGRVVLSPTIVVPRPRPPAGTPCLVLIGEDKQPVQYFPIDKDVTAVGRAEPLHGHFPDVDVSAWLEPETARKVSRRHALVLRQRQDNSFLLRPLAGNTGTQINQDMVAAMHDYPLLPGTRLILGGAVRLRFEVT